MLNLKVDINEIDTGYEALVRSLKKMQGKGVDVGIQASEDSELLKIANANEFGAEIDHPGGTPYIITKQGVRFVSKSSPIVHGVTKPHKINIPSRPFIRQTFVKREQELARIGFQLAKTVLDDKLTVDQALLNWGDLFVSFIRSEVADGNNF